MLSVLLRLECTHDGYNCLCLLITWGQGMVFTVNILRQYGWHPPAGMTTTRWWIWPIIRIVSKISCLLYHWCKKPGSCYNYTKAFALQYEELKLSFWVSLSTHAHTRMHTTHMHAHTHTHIHTHTRMHTHPHTHTQLGEGHWSYLFLPTSSGKLLPTQHQIHLDTHFELPEGVFVCVCVCVCVCARTRVHARAVHLKVGDL